MSHELAARVRASLVAKDELNAHLASDRELLARLRELQAWQTRRLRETYADLHEIHDFQPAIEFFLSDLYGGGDHSRRDQELRRAWSLMQASLPESAMQILGDALDLDLLTLSLDTAVARNLSGNAVTPQSYSDAYRAANQRDDRIRQIDIVVALARRLSAVVRNPWIGRLLRIAKRPAIAAGYAVLQSFLERGFNSFARLRDAEQLILSIDERERTLMRRLFAGDSNPFAQLQVAVASAQEVLRERT